ncbi:hypothetical protein L5515_006501 [Caenorhabditis briggsae]|uniref:Uncharacterized protein n=1 Tax=Caenorhabditis briggsae TaxID=6238 RepID=A0AAE9F2T1_CAEBR|nr:hypothetical protein L5515_006501 [Caenorhabditis briggsae]
MYSCKNHYDVFNIQAWSFYMRAEELDEKAPIHKKNAFQKRGSVASCFKSETSALPSAPLSETSALPSAPLSETSELPEPYMNLGTF